VDHLPVSAGEAQTLFARLERYKHLAIAVSGGPDSLALLYLLARWTLEAGPRPRLTALTVDHGLRSESRAEAEMVGRVAASLGVPHAILTWDGAKAGSGGLQARARAARYDLMARYCHAQDMPALVVAHHIDDQAETFLMRLKRGSGLDGLAAIPEESAWAGIAVLRPLLDLPKARLAATLAAAGLSPADDPSNADPRFERVRVRASGGALASLGLTPAALARSAKRLRRARAALEGCTDRFLTEHAHVSEAGYCLLAADALEAAPEEIALRALGRVLVSVGGRSEPVRLAKLEALRLALTESPRGAHTLGGCRIAPAGGAIGIFREARGAGLPELQLRPGERALWDNRFRVSLGTDEASPVLVRALGGEANEQAALHPWIEALPRFARITLPACSKDGTLVLPCLGGHQAAASRGFSADFIGEWNLARSHAG
jgi:tRNA(Ile)-lysidine synthase